MAGSSKSIVARLLWFFPALLFALTIYLVVVAVDIHRTLILGQPATAEVVQVVTTDRSEISYDYLDLRVQLADGRVIEKRKMSIPHSFLPYVQDQKNMAVRVRPGAAQEVVLDQLGRAHWRLAASQAAMSLMGALLLGWGVFAWNRYLARHGDPALQVPAEA